MALFLSDSHFYCSFPSISFEIRGNCLNYYSNLPRTFFEVSQLSSHPDIIWRGWPQDHRHQSRRHPLVHLRSIHRLNLKFDCFNSRGRQVKGKSLSLFLASTYHPCHDVPHEQFLETLNSILQQVPQNSNLIIGADINAKVGCQDCDEFKAVLGPHGPPQRNTHGSNLLSLYLSHEIHIENTFFDSPNHTTFTNIKDGDKTMIYVFTCAKKLHRRVRNCRTIADGVESDHTAVQLDLVLTSLKRTASTALHCGTTDWRKIETDQPTRQRYNDLLTDATVDLPDMSYEDFNDAIHKAGEETALLVGSRCEDWFQFNLADLVPPIEERNQLLHALPSSADLPPSIIYSMRVQLQCLNKHVKDKVLIAKA